jgi:hypothetical protein
MVATMAAPVTFRDAVASVLKARAGQWVPWYELAAVGGACGWRTRLSEARRLGMVIENKVEQRADRVKVSYYRFRPDRLF